MQPGRISFNEPHGQREPLRFHKGSWAGVLALLAVIAALALRWPELARAEWDAIFAQGHWAANMDWLLLGLGVFFFLCVALSPDKQDLATAAAGIFGGIVIEVWGTRTGLWYYYTGERPPLWILPAWGISALSNEKLQRALLPLFPAGWRAAILDEQGTRAQRLVYFSLVSLLFLFFLWWSRPALLHPYTFAVAALLFFALRSSRYPAYALSLFFSGALLGVFLEIWGTTRHCWNYYDGKTPSPFPICGHGLAALAFWRLKEAGTGLVRRAKAGF
jgi:hypothetical protein